MAVDPLALVDPELRAAAVQMKQGYARFHPMDLDKLADRRAMIASMSLPPLPDVPVVEKSIPVGEGHPDATIFIVNAQPGRSRPAVVHAHGGGYNASTARGGLPRVQELARDLDCTIVTVEYRLAPETTYAGSSEDMYAALRWTHAEAAEIGIDRSRIAVMGESAGGGHAAMLAINARDRGEVPILFQLLVYPMIDDRTASSRPMPDHVGAFGWSADANRFGWRCFLGQEPGGPDVPARAAAARVEDLSGLPPAFIGVGALDLFVDECIEYGRRLVQAGVPTELLVVPGAIHGFDMFHADLAISRRFTAAKVDALRRAFASA